MHVLFTNMQGTSNFSKISFQCRFECKFHHKEVWSRTFWWIWKLLLCFCLVSTVSRSPTSDNKCEQTLETNYWWDDTAIRRGERGIEGMWFVKEGRKIGLEGKGETTFEWERDREKVLFWRTGNKRELFWKGGRQKEKKMMCIVRVFGCDSLVSSHEAGGTLL